MSRQVSPPGECVSSGHWSPYIGEAWMAPRPQVPVHGSHILSGLLLQRQGSGRFDLDLKVSGPQF